MMGLLTARLVWMLTPLPFGNKLYGCCDRASPGAFSLGEYRLMMVHPREAARGHGFDALSYVRTTAL